MKNNLEENMTKPTKEQVEKWRDEGRRYLIDYFVEASSLEEIIIDSSDSEIDRGEWIDDVINSNTQIGQVEACLAAKKSNFEEIKPIKEQLKDVTQLLRIIKSARSPSDIITCEQELEKFLEKQDKENKE